MVFIAAAPLHAADNDEVTDILPPVIQADENKLPLDSVTDPALRLTPDKSELIRLDAPAGSVIIGNPLHINIIADSSTTLVVVPRLPGATHFTILGKDGQVLMQRHVIIASPKKDYIRIKRVCSEDSKKCQNTSVLYCPNMCHEIGLNTGEEADSSQEEAASGEGGNSASSAPAKLGDEQEMDIK